ncbi:MAG TPA: hypothetical protein VMM38_11015 [Aridibacter sp.]|nr:hypothetical protein [Aridibacter sp.]
MKAFSVLLVVFSLTAAALPQTDLPETLAKNRSIVRVVDGSLQGEGAEILLREGRNSQFFLIGESHGIAELPLLASALFEALNPHGYEYFAIETGPITASRIEEMAREPGGMAGFNFEFPLSLPFFNFQEEAAFVESVLKRSKNRKNALWGLDQEFAASAAIHLPRLLELAEDTRSRSIVRPFAEKASTEIDRIIASGNPSEAFLGSATDEDLEKLESAFKGTANSEAKEILEELRASRDIYRMFFTGKGYESNLERSRLMKGHFTSYYERAGGNARKPKVLFKFGSNHMTRARNYTNVFDIGSLASAIADGNGSSSFHLYVVATSGSQNRYIPFHKNEADKQKKIVPETSFADLDPFLGIADKENWTLVDLRPLRPLIHGGKLKDLPRGFADLVWGFDAVLLMPNVKASTLFDTRLD